MRTGVIRLAAAVTLEAREDLRARCAQSSCLDAVDIDDPHAAVDPRPLLPRHDRVVLVPELGPSGNVHWKRSLPASNCVGDAVPSDTLFVFLMVKPNWLPPYTVPRS